MIKSYAKQQKELRELKNLIFKKVLKKYMTPIKIFPLRKLN